MKEGLCPALRDLRIPCASKEEADALAAKLEDPDRPILARTQVIPREDGTYLVRGRAFCLLVSEKGVSRSGGYESGDMCLDRQIRLITAQISNPASVDDCFAPEELPIPVVISVKMPVEIPAVVSPEPGQMV
jgi:hypothetical protein